MSAGSTGSICVLRGPPTGSSLGGRSTPRPPGSLLVPLGHSSSPWGAPRPPGVLHIPLGHSSTLTFSCRTAASTFKDFELASVQQRPDTVLRQRFRERLRGEERTKSILTKPRTNRFVKLAVMGLTVALGAAALAVVKSALEWAPKFELQIFP